ncbi:unnamed protein product [Owenia fusiformis]|uniref:Uncharacterized protein n=1 Tax=Owenia fusiformis TaxID=6347 RepID=A0A8J1Y8K7_OWEFU|nr:unnamed protein product [Owenia fusiformis]
MGSKTLLKFVASYVSKRQFSSTSTAFKFNQPPSANDLQRPAGIASFMRLPVQETTDGLDACFWGLTLDSGASNKAGTRHGPRQIRAESAQLKFCNGLGAAPFDSLQVADVGDLPMCMYNLPQACQQIKEGTAKLIENGCKTLTMGGDHTITYPILQAFKEKYGPVGLIHIDAHTDTGDTMMGAKIAHGTPFRRAVEEKLIDPHKTVQIGLRGTSYTPDDMQWGIDQGFTVYPATECWHKSLVPVMEDVRKLMGDMPVYVSFDIDALDPSFCPGTGTLEIGGLTSIQGLEIVRGCKGLNVVGGDVVEVSPPYDFQGQTAYTAANLLFEMLCILPGVQYKK